MDSKYLVLLLPFGSAVSWAIIFVVSERSYHHISVPTNLVSVGTATILAGILLSFLLKQPIDFGPYLTHPNRHLFWIVFAVSILGASFLHISLKNMSASYTALIESFYILLTPLCAWLFFSDKQWTATTAVGAVLMLSGIFLVVHDKARQIAAQQ